MTRWIALCAVAALLAGCGRDEAAAGANGGSCSNCAGAGGGAGSGGTTGGGGGAGQAGDTSGCNANVDGIAVAPIDLDAFPSYAIDGCQLLYVAASDGSLRLRALANGQEETVAPASEAPRRPTLAGDVLAWEADENGKSAVRVRDGAEAPKTLGGSFDHAGEPRATSDAVVFTAWSAASADSDTDVWLYTRADAKASLLAGGPGQQRFADISPSDIAISDFSEDPTGIYNGDGGSLADVIVIDRASGARTTRALPGKQAFPMLGAQGFLAYLEWLEVHPLPKLQDYTIQAVPLSTLDAAATQLAHVVSDQAVRPAARANRVEWVVRANGTSALWRSALDGATPPSEVPLGNVSTMYAPSATATLTVLAVGPTSSATPTLIGVSEQ